MEGSKVEAGKATELSGVIEVNEEQIRSRLHEVVRGAVEEALIEMSIAGVSVRRVEDITEALWGTRVSASTVSELNKKLYIRLEESWRGFDLSKTRNGTAAATSTRNASPRLRTQ